MKQLAQNHVILLTGMKIVRCLELTFIMVIFCGPESTYTVIILIIYNNQMYIIRRIIMRKNIFMVF